MAQRQQLTKSKNVQIRNPELIRTCELIVTDWDSYLYSLWLENMTLNPGLFDDARISHTSGACKCRCTRNTGWLEEVRNKRK